jgi:hypothetical protein
MPLTGRTNEVAKYNGGLLKHKHKRIEIQNKGGVTARTSNQS